MTFIFVVGTRPEIIKCFTVSRELEKKGRKTVILFTGQHYSPEMSDSFLSALFERKPDHFLKLNSGSPGERMGEMISKISRILLKYERGTVIVVGDTDSTLAGAVSAKRQGWKLAHIESGFRSFDERMPEEFSRILTDHASDILFAASQNSVQNLLNENIAKEKIHFTGNTIEDASILGAKLAEKNSKILEAQKLKKNNYALLTLHRQENVDSKEKFSEFLEAVSEIKLKIVYPIHPRSRKNIEKFGLKVPENVLLLDPLNYFDFLKLLINAKMVLTDSGGIQEEALIHNIPLVTMRLSTEYAESIKAGKNILAFTKKEITDSADKILNKGLGEKMRKIKNPYYSEKVSEKIVSLLLDFEKNK
ncbi:MAG: UDP-N-acetylglucosamine 2-epimerase (non-hydrolyzing) [Candidatus Diapherotrites archaeon]